MQQDSNPQYKSGDALARGTLFPGLDLPWKNVVNNTDVANTPCGELMALNFVITELKMYLDTHKNDREALELFVSYTKLYKEGYERYVRLYGPIEATDVTDTAFTWVNNPWPWDYTERTAQ
jgi:spore coat protein JB